MFKNEYNKNIVEKKMLQRRLTGLFTLRRLTAARGSAGLGRSACRPRSRALLHPQFGQGSMLRIALLPAQTVANSRNVMCNAGRQIC